MVKGYKGKHHIYSDLLLDFIFGKNILEGIIVWCGTGLILGDEVVRKYHYGRHKVL